MRDHLLKCFDFRTRKSPSQHENGDLRGNISECARNDLIEASVLIPIIDRPDGLSILFTQRSQNLKNHPGQVSFPGGRAELNDQDAIATALRECHEEIGLRPERVNILGRLETCLTGTGFKVTPIVGLVEEPLALQLALDEVSEIFEVPLPLLLENGRYRTDCVELPNGETRTFYIFDYPKRYIWGATAKMLVNLRNLLQSNS
tara:strand:- start:1915 stop:2523 length:609 start_codon:yes stop_codon:yes gene_type:complete